MHDWRDSISIVRHFVAFVFCQFHSIAFMRHALSILFRQHNNMFAFKREVCVYTHDENVLNAVENRWSNSEWRRTLTLYTTPHQPSVVLYTCSINNASVWNIFNGNFSTLRPLHLHTLGYFSIFLSLSPFLSLALEHTLRVCVCVLWHVQYRATLLLHCFFLFFFFYFSLRSFYHIHIMTVTLRVFVKCYANALD